MKTNRYYQVIDLSRLKFTLKQSLGWHMARVSFLVEFMIALLKVRTVNMSELSVALAGKAKCESKYKRLQRFMRLHRIDFGLFAIFLARLIPSSEDSWLLTVDRTNWKFGKLDINILMLAVAYKGVAFPLMWKLLPKSGNSNTEERISLIARFVKIFGVERIQCLTADREFIGLTWFDWLNKNKVPFCIRIRENICVSSTKGNKVKVKDLFKGLRQGQTRVIRGQRKICGTMLYVVGLKIKPKIHLILATNKRPEQALEDYKKRWEIETLFGCLKTRGFNFEDTHISEPSRIMNMVALLSVTFCWCHLTGEWKAGKRPIPFKNHGRKAISLFRYGLDALRETLFNLMPDRREIQTMISLLTSRLHTTPSPGAT